MIPKTTIPSPSLEQIEELRTEFFKKLDRDGAQIDGGFHPKDLERIKTSNIWLQRFLEQQDLQLRAAVDMLWDSCKWRKEFGTNDITTDNINMDYLRVGIVFPHNVDVDGKAILIFKSKLHIRGTRDSHQLLRVFVYWVERLQREQNYDFITMLFDLENTGLSNLDLDHTKKIVNILKYYYPNAVNYLIIYEMPWVLTAAFKIIKALMPPKAVASLRFVTSKNVTDYISEDNLLTCWGGTDRYEFEFEPEQTITNGINGHHEYDDIDAEKAAIIKKVHFANLSTSESTMSESQGSNYKNSNENGKMLMVMPNDIIKFTKNGNEMVGIINLTNTSKKFITYKIRTTSPEKFRIRPSTDILGPGSSTNVCIVLQAVQNASLEQHKDKFLIMCMELNDRNATPQELIDLWKSTQNNDVSVEQHRLKCISITDSNISAITDVTRNGNLHASNGPIPLDGDRQFAHMSNSISQLVESTRRLESRVKFNQKLQWITVFVFLLLSIAIVYILKIEIHKNSAEYCLKPTRHSYK